MLTGMELMSCQNLAVPAEVMHHVVDVESGYNPYAIGVVGSQLVRQPQSLSEALATVQMLESKGYNFSVGVAQVNRANLTRYGLDSYEKAFDPCQNLAVGSRILNACYYSSGGDWGKAFSCYYSGNFVTGFRDGYVQKVYNSINRSVNLASNGNTAAPIPLQLVGARSSAHGAGNVALTTDSAAYRVAIRSMLLDTAAGMATAPVASALASAQSTPTRAAAATLAQTAPAAPAVATSTATATASATGKFTSDDIFVPTVRGPTDPLPSAPAASSPAPAQKAVASVPIAAADQADLRQGGQDNAFVF